MVAAFKLESLAGIVGIRTFHKHKDFAVFYVILCEKLRICFRVDPYRGVRVARLDSSYGATFVSNGN
jgi:hypothetical protein